MAMENFSKYQQSIIKNYYKNRDDVSLQRAQELLTELYLAEGKKTRKSLGCIVHQPRTNRNPSRSTRTLAKRTQSRTRRQMAREKTISSSRAFS